MYTQISHTLNVSLQMPTDVGLPCSVYLKYGTVICAAKALPAKQPSSFAPEQQVLEQHRKWHHCTEGKPKT